MAVSRRDFLKVATVGGVGTLAFGFDLTPAYAAARELKIARTTETRSTCPYCAVSCGVIIHTLGDKAKNVTGATVVHVEGDPDHPINRGTLCPKGVSLKHDILNNSRLNKPLYRAPGSDRWEEKSWDWMFENIAQRMKKTRDATFKEKNDAGQIINQCLGIAMVGGCTDNNEVNFLLVKWLRALGVVHTDNQARL
ncbi:MAG: twin-arginine translocation signal domain-containing protein [Chloracidobacterium sp.]|nr:twin-arginine translocation signal domain-containing protein [Chloracidobacterium sp.]